MFRSVVMVAMAVMMVSCVTRGSNFSSRTDWIKTNSTTRNDVAQQLGEPFLVGKSSGDQTWTYGYYLHRLFGGSRTKELKLYWNNDGTIKSYSFNSSFPEDKAAMLRPTIRN